MMTLWLLITCVENDACQSYVWSAGKRILWRQWLRNTLSSFSESSAHKSALVDCYLAVLGFELTSIGNRWMLARMIRPSYVHQSCSVALDGVFAETTFSVWCWNLNVNVWGEMLFSYQTVIHKSTCCVWRGLTFTATRMFSFVHLLWIFFLVLFQFCAPFLLAFFQAPPLL